MKLYKSCSDLTVKLIEYIKENPGTINHMNSFLMRYEDAVLNFITLSVGNYHDSLEITNKVLLTLSVKVKEIRKAKAFNALALKVIKGEIGNHWRTVNAKKRKLVKAKDQYELFSMEMLSNNNKASELFESLLIREIIENIQDPHLKNIFLLAYRDDKNVSYIARELNISRYQVKKSMEHLHKKIIDYIGE